MNTKKYKKYEKKSILCSNFLYSKKSLNYFLSFVIVSIISTIIWACLTSTPDIEKINKNHKYGICNLQTDIYEPKKKYPKKTKLKKKKDKSG